jgi:imidazolonepropionase-like amidohydrolase
MSEGDVPTARGLTVEEMRAAIEEAHNVGKKTMAHAQGSNGIRNAIIAGISSIEHGFYLTDDIIELMLKQGVSWFLPYRRFTTLWSTEQKQGFQSTACERPGGSEGTPGQFPQGL